MSSLNVAIQVCCKPANLRRTLGIAATVGVVLTAINEGDLLVEGKASAATAIKIAMNFVIPFLVSNLGVLTGTRSADRWEGSG